MISADRTGAGVAAHDVAARTAAMNESRPVNLPATPDSRSPPPTTVTSLGPGESIDHATRFHRGNRRSSIQRLHFERCYCSTTAHVEQLEPKQLREIAGPPWFFRAARLLLDQ
jgi:hypothetical protein